MAPNPDFAHGSENALARFLAIDGLSFDLFEGTVVDPSDERAIFLSTDILRGIHAALSYEAGDAWRLMLQRCGVLWGQRVYRSFSRMGRNAFKKSQEQVSVSEFTALLKAYLKHNGWGVLDVDMSHAPAHGVLVFRLANSIFVHALEDLREKVDYMVAGMLTGLYSELARVELECVEVGSPLLGAEHTTYLLSAKSRMDELRHRVDAGEEYDEIIRHLTN